MLENFNENNIWKKRFSVGIAIETTLSDFEGMLENYGRYIDNFYCSLPLGDKFHGRTHVANQFKNPENIQKFWEIAKMINKSDVGFEIVFNTDKLTKEDFYMCRNELMKLVKNTLIQALLNCLNSVQEMQIQNSFANVSIVTFMITGKNM